jgi:hypothetical protein
MRPGGARSALSQAAGFKGWDMITISKSKPPLADKPF